METAFTSEAECREYLRVALTAPGSQLDDISPEVQSALLEACVQASAAQRRRGFSLTMGSWVIKNGDLDLFGSLRAAAIALASGKVFVGSAELSAVAALLLSIIALLRNAYRNGARLQAEEIEVLGALVHGKRPLLTAEIADLVANRDDNEKSPVDIESVLRRLTAVPTRTGTAKLVAEITPGTWVSCDV